MLYQAYCSQVQNNFRYVTTMSLGENLGTRVFPSEFYSTYALKIVKFMWIGDDIRPFLNRSRRKYLKIELIFEHYLYTADKRRET